MKAPERFGFAIRFAQMDLAGLRPGDWLNLRDDLQRFLWDERVDDGTLRHTTGIVARTTDGPMASYPEEKLRGLQDEVRGVLHGIAERRNMGEVAAEPSRALSVQVALLPAAPQLRHAVPVFLGTLRDMFLLVLVSLLAQEAGGQIRECPECQGLFVRVRRQMYCSGTCSNRWYMREWLKTAQGRRYLKARAAARTSKVPKKMRERAPGPGRS